MINITNISDLSLEELQEVREIVQKEVDKRRKQINVGDLSIGDVFIHENGAVLITKFDEDKDVIGFNLDKNLSVFYYQSTVVQPVKAKMIIEKT